EKISDHVPSFARMSGMSTDARRCSGASISTAGRRASIARRRSSDESSKRGGMPRLRLEHRNSFDGVIEPQCRATTMRNGERRLLARREIARQLEPAIGDLVRAVEKF